MAVLDSKENVGEESNSRGHEYSLCTRKLLETVSFLLRSIEEVRNGNGDGKKVEEALKAVKKKEELQEGIFNELYVELRGLKSEKQGLEKRLEEIVDDVVKAKGEYEKLVGGGEEGNERSETLEGILRGLEEEYEGKWGRTGEVEDMILRKDTVALSFGVRELCFIERECDELVKRFNRAMRQKGIVRYVWNNSW